MPRPRRAFTLLIFAVRPRGRRRRRISSAFPGGCAGGDADGASEEEERGGGRAADAASPGWGSPSQSCSSSASTVLHLDLLIVMTPANLYCFGWCALGILLNPVGIGEGLQRYTTIELISELHVFFM
uniref:Uncharacterized protein n=1 Tax=Aegilops tauschii TaxID=37682 RepID=M8BWQ7_AEGTA